MIIRIDGQELDVPLKTAAILRMLLETSPEIERLSKGQVTFHFRGRSVIPELTLRFLPGKGERQGTE